MKTILFFGLVSAEVTYKVLTWNLAGINNSPYEFHNKNNEPFILALENRLESGETYIKYLYDKDEEEFLTIAGCDTGEVMENKLNTRVNELFSNTALHTLVGDADRYTKGRPTFDLTEAKDPISFHNEWSEFFTKNLETLKNKTREKFCEHISHLYVRDMFLFNVRFEFLKNKNNSILPAWPQDSKEKLRKLFAAYKDTVDIFALQETSLADVNAVVAEMNLAFTVYCNDAESKQASVVLLSKEKFKSGKVYSEVLNSFEKDKKVQQKKEKEVVVKAVGLDGLKMTIASYHAESNGMDSLTFVEKLRQFSYSVVVLGMDANTDKNPEKDDKGVTNTNLSFTKFVGDSQSLGYNVAMTEIKDVTTKKIRTIAQAQIKKGVLVKGVRSKVEEHPKDNVLSLNAESSECIRDNTFRGIYEDRLLPDNDFLSDHVIVVCDVTPRAKLNPVLLQSIWDHMNTVV